MYECIKTLIHSFFTAQGFCIDGPRLEMDCSTWSPRILSAYIPCTCFDFPVVRHGRSPLRLMRSCARLFPQVPALCCALLAGCSGEESVTEWADLTLIPELRIDGHESVLSQVTNVAVSRDGTIAISERPAQTIRFFNSEGELLDESFRQGEGPGEFRVVASLGWVADTLWVFDFRLDRITLISPDRQLARTFPTPTPARPGGPNPSGIPEYRRVQPEALYTSGSTVAHLYSPIGDPSEEFPEGESIYGLVSSDGVIQEIVARIPPSPSRFVYQGEGMAVNMPYPFAIETFFSVAPDGSRIVLVDVSVEEESGAVVEALALAPTGDTIYDVDIPVEASPIPSHVVDSMMDVHLEALEQIGGSVGRAYRSQAYVPPVYPPVMGVVVSADGGVWLKMRDTEEGRPYYILDPDGRPAGRVLVPNNVEIRAADRTHVWAVEKDELDVPSILRFRIEGVS